MPPAISTVAEVAVSVVDTFELFIVMFSAVRFSALPAIIPATLPNSLETAEDELTVTFLITVSFALPITTPA